MKLPRISLPSLPRGSTGKKTSGSGSKSGPRFSGSPLSGFLLGTIVLLACFVIGFLLAFPRASLLNRVEYEISRRSPVQVRIGELSLAFPFGIEARKVQVSSPVEEMPPFKFATVTVQPFLGSLFGSNPGASFQAEVPPGEISGWARRKGELELEALRVPVQVPKFGPSSLGFSALIQSGSLSGSLPPRGEEESLIDFRLERALLTGMESLGAPNPTLSLGQITLKASGKGSTLKLEELQSQGGEVELSGDGHLQVGETLSSSRLNLNLTLAPKAGFPAELSELLGLFIKPRRDGSFRMKLAGPVTQLSVH